MATPHVTGGIALYAASRPSSSAAQRRQAIMDYAKQTQSLATITATGGRLDVSGF
jgi:hypothetical protein